jgi:anti-anti-sigma regulatory factor
VDNNIAPTDHVPHPMGNLRRHACLMHTSEAWRRARVTAWSAAALARRKRVVCLTAAPQPALSRCAAPDSEDSTPTLDWLRAGGIDEDYLRTGALQVLDDAALEGLLPSGTGYSAAEARDVLTDWVDGALHEGYDGLAVTTGSAARHRVLPDQNEQLALEANLDKLVAERPLAMLCQFSPRIEPPEMPAQFASIHYQEVIDGCWSATARSGGLALRGEIDATNATHVAAVLGTAAQRGIYDIDLSELRFLAVAGARVLHVHASDLYARGQALHLHRTPRPIRRILETLEVTAHPAVAIAPG